MSPANWPEFRRDDERDGFDPGQTLITKENVSTLIPKWVFSQDAGTFENPIVDNGSVYFGDMNGKFFALDEGTGALEWTVAGSSPGDGFIGTPALYNGVLYDGSYLGRFVAVDARTGEIVESYPAIGTDPVSYESSPIISGSTVIEGRSNLDEATGPCLTGNQLVGFSLSAPSLVDSLSLTPGGTTGVGIWSSPMIGPDGSMYLATGNSCGTASSPYADSMVKLGQAALSVRWTSGGAPDAGGDLDFGATPIYVNGLVVDGAKNGTVYAYNAVSGQLVWKTNAGITGGAIIGSAATDGTQIYVPYDAANGGGAVVALSLTGSVVWTVATGSATDPYGTFGVISAPVVSQGVVYVGYDTANCQSNCHGISALDAATGRLLWRYPTAGFIADSPTIVQGGLLVGELDGPNLYLFTPGGK